MHTKTRSVFRRPTPSRLTAAVALVVALLAADVAHAQSGKGGYIGGWSIAGGLGYALPNTDVYSDEFTWRAGIGYSPIPQFEIGLEYGRFETAVSQPEQDGLPNHDIASGRIVVQPVCLALQFHVPLTGTMSTFNLLAGAGYYFVDYEMGDAQREFFSSSGVEGLPNQVVHDTWGLHVGAGLEYALSGWLSLTVEGRYVFLAPDVTGTTKESHSITGSLDLNTWLFTGGIKVAF